MTAQLRIPGPDDADSIASLHVATWKETYGHLLPDDFFSADHAEGRRRMWTRLLGDPHPEWTVRIAEVDGKAAGFVLVGPPPENEASPRGRLLYSIYVLAEYYGSGVGQALLESGLGRDPAFLWVEKTNAKAQAFYRRNGFELDGVEQVDDHHPELIELRMVRW